MIRDHDILYIYSNKIDKTGDDKMTEGEVFVAVRQEIEHLRIGGALLLLSLARVGYF